MKKLFLLNLLLSFTGLLIGQPLLGVDLADMPEQANFELTELEVTSQSAQKVKLSWTILHNSPDLTFFVQKKSNSGEFMTIGGFRGSLSKSCTFFDLNPQKNILVTYRIKILSSKFVDYQYLSSNTDFIHKADFTLPAVKSSNGDGHLVKLKDYAGKSLRVVGMSFNGQQVFSRMLKVNQSGYLFIPTEQLDKGRYSFQLYVGGQLLTSKILIN
ncbi:MAG: hypothetical protein AAFY71_00590 [Bacteroidota bacterium]